MAGIKTPTRNLISKNKTIFQIHTTGAIATIAIPNTIMQTRTNVLLPRSMRTCLFSPKERAWAAAWHSLLLLTSTMPSGPLRYAEYNAKHGTIIEGQRDKTPTALRHRLTRAIEIIAQNRLALSLSALAGAGPALRASQRKVGSDIAPFLRPRAKFPMVWLQPGPRILLGGGAALPDRLGLREDGGEPPSTSVPPCPGVRQVRLSRPP